MYMPLTVDILAVTARRRRLEAEPEYLSENMTNADQALFRGNNLVEELDVEFSHTTQKYS